MKKAIATTIIVSCLLFLLAYFNQEQINTLAVSLFVLLFISVIIFLYNSYELYKSQISLKKFTQAVENSDNIVMITDYDKKIKYVNQAFTDFTGYTLEEVIGKNPGAIQDGQNAKTFYKKLNQTIYSGEKWSGIFINKAKSGKKQYEKATITPIKNNSGQIVEFVGLKLNITKEIDDQNALREKDKKFFQQSKMASMGEMLVNIAHHWRQPLSLISTVATSIDLQREIGMLNDEKLAKGMQDINKSVQSLSSTIVNNNQTKESFILSDIINRAINILAIDLENNQITLDLSNNLEIPMFGYSNELIQAILNILNNAKDILLLQDERIIQIKTFDSSCDVEIVICDNDGGIPDEIIRNIFEPYFTTKHKSQGTGMGLYNSYMIIMNKMNGEISATNDEFILDNKKYFGAKFTLKIPKNG